MLIIAKKILSYLLGSKTFWVILVFSLVALWVHGQIKDKEDALAKEKVATARADKAEAELTDAKSILETERKAAADANARAKQTQLEKQVIQNEAKANADCIRNRTCGVRVELKYQTCPVSSANASGSGADELQEQNRRNFELWINDLKESVRLDNLYIVKLQEDVKVRSSADYCKPK